MLLTIFHTPQDKIPWLGFCKSSPVRRGSSLSCKKRVSKGWRVESTSRGKRKRLKAGADYGGLEWPWLVLVLVVLVLG